MNYIWVQEKFNDNDFEEIISQELDEKMICNKRNKFNFTEEELLYYNNLLKEEEKHYEKNETEEKNFKEYFNLVIYFICEKLEAGVQKIQKINAGFLKIDTFNNFIKKSKKKSSIYVRKIKGKHYFYKKYNFDKNDDFTKLIPEKNSKDFKYLNIFKNLNLNDNSFKILVDSLSFSYNCNFNYLKISYKSKFLKFENGLWKETF